MSSTPNAKPTDQDRRIAAEHLKEAAGLLIQAMRDVLLNPHNAKLLVQGATDAADYRARQACAIMGA